MEYKTVQPVTGVQARALLREQIGLIIDGDGAPMGTVLGIIVAIAEEIAALKQAKKFQSTSDIITLLDIDLPGGERLSFVNSTEEVVFDGVVYKPNAYTITIMDGQRGK